MEKPVSEPQIPGLTRGERKPDIVQRLKTMVISGEIAPGSRLNEAALASQLGVSRGPVREAISVLAGMGFVTAVANRGVYVRQLSVKEMLDLYDLRAAVFGMAALRAAELLTRERRARLEDLIARMTDAGDAEDSEAYYALNLEFHSAILDCCNNPRAKRAYESFADELHGFRQSYFGYPVNMRRSNQEHRSIVEAILAGDADAARRAAENHVLNGRARLLSTFSDQFVQPD
jgi:DNA-binding GntR family transcriptional regulator